MCYQPRNLVQQWISPLNIFHFFFSYQSICAAVAYFYSNYFLLQWQLLIMVVVGFFGTITFFAVEWKAAALLARSSDYSSIWSRYPTPVRRSTFIDKWCKKVEGIELKRLRWRKLLINHHSSNWTWNTGGENAESERLFPCFNQLSVKKKKKILC